VLGKLATFLSEENVSDDSIYIVLKIIRFLVKGYCKFISIGKVNFILKLKFMIIIYSHSSMPEI